MGRKLLSDQEIKDQVEQDITWARDHRQDRREDWRRFHKLYRNYIDQASYPYEANLAIPTAYSIIEVQVAFLTDMIMEGGDFVEVLGKTPEGQASAKAVREMLNYHFRYSIDTFPEMEKFIRQLLMYGTSVFRTDWDYRLEWKTRNIPVLDDTGELLETKEEFHAEEVANQPGGRAVDISVFGVDPNAGSITDARYAFEEMWVDPMILLEKQQLKLYKNVEKLFSDQSNATNDGLMEREEDIGLTSFQNSPYVERGKIHIVDYWGYLTKGWENGKLGKASKRQLYHVVLAMSQATHAAEGTSTVLFARPSPYFHNRIPFIDARINGCVGEFYGVGDIEYVESLLLEQRDMRNIQHDNMTRTMNKMFKRRREANIDKAQLIWRPGGVIDVNELEDVDVVRSEPVDPAVFKAQEDILRDIEMSTGINDFVTGQYRSATGFNDTATGISLIQNTAMKRMAHKGQVVQQAIRDIGQMVFNLVAQYSPMGTTVRILDRENATLYRFIDISPEALSREYDFHIINAAALGSKMARQTQLLQLFQILGQIKGEDAGFLDRFLLRLLDEMDIPNAQELLGNPQLYSALPPSLGSPAEQQDLYNPEEENRIMVETGRFIEPKLEEHHPQHMAVHQAEYDKQQNPEIRKLIAEHYNIHAKMSEQVKAMIGQQMALGIQQDAVDQQEAQLRLLSGGKGATSPNAAGGQEAVIRNMASQQAGSF